MTKMQVAKKMQEASITGELSGRGQNWEVELPNEKAKRKFQKLVCNVGGFRCGYGGWVLRPGYTCDGLDYCNPASRLHY